VIVTNTLLHSATLPTYINEIRGECGQTLVLSIPPQKWKSGRWENQKHNNKQARVSMWGVEGV